MSANKKRPFDFNQSLALVIGGGSGIGKEIAAALAEHGANVLIAGRRNDILSQACDEINALNCGDCHYYRVDITDENSLDKLFDFVCEHFGSELNILVNSAGTNIRSPLEDIIPEDFKAVMETNLTGVLRTIQKMSPLLKSASYGRIINLASIFSRVSYPGRISYSSSKGAIALLSKTLALEWAEEKITVNTISPGPLLTDINLKVLEDTENYNKFCERIPMRRFGDPDEVVTAALFLASRMSGYVTGSDIVVDGGWTAS